MPYSKLLEFAVNNTNISLLHYYRLAIDSPRNRQCAIGFVCRDSQHPNRDDPLNVRIRDRVGNAEHFRARTRRDDAFWHLLFRSINADATSHQNAMMEEFWSQNPEQSWIQFDPVLFVSAITLQAQRGVVVFRSKMKPESVRWIFMTSWLPEENPHGDFLCLHTPTS